MSIKIMLQFNGKNLTIPINPEALKITRSANNEDINIVGLGKATRKGEPGLKTLSIKSFFPGSNSYFYTGVSPSTCINFIDDIWKAENINNNVAKFVTLGLPIDISMYVVINNFDYDHKAGEEEDIYYELTLKEYIPYGVKTVDVKLSGLAAARAQSTAANKATSASSRNTYVVQKNDCLWNIAKACSGNGNDWSKLYELNKAIIGSNPNLIKPGQVLTLPDGWQTPQSVTKLKSSTSSSTTKKVTSKTTLDKYDVSKYDPTKKQSITTFMDTLRNKYYNLPSSGAGLGGGFSAGGGFGGGGGRRRR